MANPKKLIYFIDHAREMFIERGIPLRKVREMLEEGFLVEHPEDAHRRICIYKGKNNVFYTVITYPTNAGTFIITGYPSKPWEKKMYLEREK